MRYSRCLERSIERSLQVGGLADRRISVLACSSKRMLCREVLARCCRTSTSSFPSSLTSPSVSVPCQPSNFFHTTFSYQDARMPAMIRQSSLPETRSREVIGSHRAAPRRCQGCCCGSLSPEPPPLVHRAWNPTQNPSFWYCVRSTSREQSYRAPTVQLLCIFIILN